MSTAATERPAELQQRIKHFATVRSAERAMAVSSLALQDDACAERAGRTRALLEGFLARCDGGDFPDSEWHTALAEIDEAIDHHVGIVLEALDGVTIAQLRSTMPAHAASHRNEVLSLVQLILEDEAKVGSRLPALEYVLTLLSTTSEGGRRKIAFDPVTLSPTIQGFCLAQELTFEGDATEYELQIHQAAADLDASLDPGPAARQMRATKTKLGTKCLTPGILRAIITYNTRMSNVMADRAQSARLADADFIQQTDASSELHDLLDAATAAQPGSPADFADASLKAASPPGSVYADEGLPVIIEALRRRLNKTPIGACTSERIALALDISVLEDHEKVALRAEERTGDQKLLAYTIVTGLLSQMIPTVGEALEEIGIQPDVLTQTWIAEVNDDLQAAIKAHLQGGDYEAGCRLSESKTRLLYAPLSAIAREAKAIRAQASSAGGASADLVNAAKAAAAQGAGQRSSVTRIGETISGWAAWKQNVLKLATGAALAALVMNFVSSAPESPLRDLTINDLSSASPYLASAYRDGHGSGRTIIGRTDSTWSTLDPEAQYAAAQEMIAALTEDGARHIMIYDPKRRLAVQFAGGEMRRPVDPAVIAARPTARDVEIKARRARDAARRAAIEAANAANRQ